jgi:hypothetical protein
VPWMPRDLKRLHKGSSNIPFSLPSLSWPGGMSGALRGPGCDRRVPFCSYLSLLCRSFFSTLPSEDYFKVVAAQTTMMRTLVSDWTPWYVELGEDRMQCRICGDDFTKVNG